MSTMPVKVRIRGRGETTLEAQFFSAETVAEFKGRVFRDDIAEGHKCRLIASGRELEDYRRMGHYRISDGACLHVMINKSRPEPLVTPSSVAAGSKEPTLPSSSSSSSSSSPSLSSSSSSPPASPPGAGRSGASSTYGLAFMGPIDGYLVLSTLTLGMLVSAWTVFMAFPELFSPLAVSLLAVLTLLQLAAMAPLLWNVVLTILAACHRSPRIMGRRRQQQ